MPRLLQVLQQPYLIWWVFFNFSLTFFPHSPPPFSLLIILDCDVVISEGTTGWNAEKIRDHTHLVIFRSIEQIFDQVMEKHLK